MKRFIFLPLILICLSSFSQSPAPSAANNYLNNLVWSQIFDNFEIKTPLALPFTPGGMFAYDANFIDNDGFLQHTLKSKSYFMEKEILAKEFTRTIKAPFLNYIPRDSTLILKALYTNRILYTLRLNKANESTNVDFMLPDSKTRQTVAFDQAGDLLLLTSNEGKKTLSIANEKLSDTHSILSTREGKDKYILREESRYDGGVLKSKEVYKENADNKKRKFVSNYSYIYDSAGKMTAIQTLNKKGKAVDSLVYYYSNDTLLTIGHNVMDEEPDLIHYQYTPDGRISLKAIREFEFNGELSYAYDKGKVSSITYVDRLAEVTNKYEFEYNVDGGLLSVSLTPIDPLYPEAELERQYLFSYDEHQNLKALKMVNRKGIIEKEIIFESDFK